MRKNSKESASFMFVLLDMMKGSRTGLLTDLSHGSICFLSFLLSFSVLFLPIFSLFFLSFFLALLPVACPCGLLHADLSPIRDRLLSWPLSDCQPWTGGAQGRQPNAEDL